MLDGQHRDNLLLMLRSLSMTPFTPVGLTGLGFPSSSVKVEPMTPEGAFDETDGMDEIAYGATLGLVYYRYMAEPLRVAWDRSIERSVSQARSTLDQQINSNRDSWLALARGGHPPGPQALATQRQTADVAQQTRRHLDFLVSLQMKKQMTFAGTSDDIVNDAKTVGQNPWCQSDSEFEQTVLQEVGNPIPNPAPAPNYGFGGKPREATTRDSVDKTFNTLLTAKSTSYLDKFLEVGEEQVKGMLRNGISHLALAVVRHVPIADLIVDWVKDQFAERSQSQLVESYKVDRTRRLRLAQWGWGLYRDPNGAVPPNAGSFTQQVLGAS